MCVLSTGEPGGAELSLVTHLRHRPSWVKAHAVLLTDGPVADALAQIGIESHRYSKRSIHLRGIANLSTGLWRQLQTVQPDVVFAVGNRAAKASVPLARITGVPCVWHKVDRVLPKWQVANLARCTRRVVAVSSAAGDFVSRDRLTVIYPPVRLAGDFLLGHSPTPATLTCAGRLEPTKGQHYLILAAALLKPRFPTLNVVLAGSTPMYAADYPRQLRNLARRLGIPVEMTGHVGAIEQVLARTTVYVQPSYQDAKGHGGEGLPVALAEASWAGLPVVATRIGGIPEAVRDGITGRLVPPCDPSALASAIDIYLSDPAAACAAGKAGADFARSRFQADQVSAELFSTLAGVIEGD